MTSKAAMIQSRLRELANPQVAGVSQRFFKTSPGSYGEGDLFRGIRVPVLRNLCREYRDAGLSEILELLGSPFHEDRLLALLMLVQRYQAADEPLREEIYELYLGNTTRINNWDLVDLSAEHIVGAFLLERDRSPLFRLAASKSLWERRIAVLATFHFIRRREFAPTLSLAELLLQDPHELIHKALGWMLREIGKRHRVTEEEFLRNHYRKMPRVMLRYAIERFEEEDRQLYLKGLVS